MEKLPEERQAAMGGELLIGGFKFERENGLWHQVFHLVGEKWLKGWAPYLSKSTGFLVLEIHSSRILGTHQQSASLYMSRLPHLSLRA